ncbi:MAG: hypothetical protein ATN35_02660 [Epulopiscium sp. Nele67-Bin004]|nr:MAG: hypothetical protein ATN35_02660 [Epulopiscium sp. Nele67-Bin004]
MGFFSWVLPTVLVTTTSWVANKIRDFFSSGGDTVKKVAKETGNTKSYDKEIATTAETLNINKILADFSLSLEKTSDSMEQKLLKETQQYFRGLVKKLENGSNDMNVDIKSINREAEKIEKQIRGSLKNYLSQRVSLDDQECLEILKLESGKTKKQAMTKFGNAVLNKGLQSTYKEVKQCVREQEQYVSDILNGKIDDIVFSTNKLIEDINKLEKNYNDDQQKKDLDKVTTMVRVLTLENAINSL